MAEENETVDDIIAKMRNEGHTGESSCLEWVGTKMRYYADRLDAAAKRMEWTHKKELETRDAVIQTEVATREAEREAHKREIYEMKKQVGDCAKLREAAEKTRATLEKALQILNGISDEEAGTLNARLEDVADEICEVTEWIIPAALAAPPRNCDVGTVKDQFARFRKFCKKDSMDSFAATAYCAHECPCGNSYDCKLAWAQMPYEGGVK